MIAVAAAAAACDSRNAACAGMQPRRVRNQSPRAIGPNDRLVRIVAKGLLEEVIAIVAGVDVKHWTSGAQHVRR